MKWSLMISMVCCLTYIHAQQDSTTTSGTILSSHTVIPTQTVMSTTPVESAVSLSPTPTVTPPEEESPYIIFAKRVAIHRTNLNGTEFDTIISNSTFTSNAIAIDFDARQNVLFWTDVEARVIARSNLDGSNATLLVDSDLSYPDGIAWDWLNKKLYWSDSEHREIEVLDPKSGDRMQLVKTGLTTIPRDVAVDPNTRWLYWTDWGEVAKIERVSMDGNHSTRQALHSTNLAWPNALTIDYTTQTLYWADAQLNKIETSNVDGSNRALLTTNLILHPFGITYHNGYLYWSDWQTDQITMTHVSTPDNVTVLVSTLDTEPMGLEVIATSRQPITSSNPCSLDNGNCSHLCLLSSSSMGGYSCACPRGMVVAQNGIDCTDVGTPTRPPEGGGSCLSAGYTSCCTSGDCLGSPAVCFCDQFCHTTDSCCDDIQTTCPDPTTTSSPPSTTLTAPFMLFANRQSINQMELNGSKLWPLINTTKNSIALDYNYRQQYIYWTDVSTKTINQARMDGSESRVLVSTNIGTPDGLACDWVTDKLYWTDAATNTISVYDLVNGYRKQLFSLSTNSTPRAIVVDPLTRWLYWSDWGRPAKIERASMDGTQEQTIVNTGLIWPNALTIDRTAQILYWADASLDKIESSNVDGTNRRILLQDGILHPFSITIFNSTLYWSDWQADTVFSSRLIGSRPVGSSSLLQRLSTEPMVVQVVSTEIQVNVTNPCELDNGNCSHLCLLSVGEGGFSCACPNGYQMVAGSTQSCVAILPPEPTTTTPSPPGSCRAAGYTTCCVDDLCEGVPPLCFCDIYCAEFDDCCDDFYEICPPNGVMNTTTSMALPVPSPTSSLPTTTSTSLQGPIDNSVLASPVATSSRRRVTSKTRTRSPPSSQLPSHTPIPPVIVTAEEEGAKLVGVGVVIGSLVAAVLVIILIALTVVLLVTLLIIRQRTLMFTRYQNFENTSVKEMTMLSNGFNNPLAHEVKA